MINRFAIVLELVDWLHRLQDRFVSGVISAGQALEAAVTFSEQAGLNIDEDKIFVDTPEKQFYYIVGLAEQEAQQFESNRGDKW